MDGIEKTIDDLLEKSGKSVAEVIEAIPDLAMAQTKKVLNSIRQTANRCADAETVYIYSGKTHRFLEKTVAALYTQIIYNDAVQQMSARQRLKRFADIESRLAKLEERGGMQYRGVWTKGMKCTRGDVVTYQGSSWHCQMDTDTAHPGDGSQCFMLMTKRGRDGKSYTGEAQ